MVHLQKTINAMEQEEWKPVVGYEGLYEVSDWGRVKSLNYRRTGKEELMKPQPATTKGEYLKVALCKNGEKELYKVHQLVMLAFIGECPDGHEIDHFDWNPNNNRLENLSYQPKEVNRARHSPEWRKNVSEGAKKRSADPEWRKNQAEANKKKAQDPEWLAKMQKLYQDPEWQKKNAEGAKKRAKPVDQFTLDGQFVKRWSSAKDAARGLGIDNSHISKCCKGKHKSTGGFIWKFSKEAV